jgi:hypothetical protein
LAENGGAYGIRSHSVAGGGVARRSERDHVGKMQKCMMQEWKKKQELAGLAATGRNVLYEELSLRRHMNSYHEFKTSSEWKNLGFLKTVRMGKEILKKDVSK